MKIILRISQKKALSGDWYGSCGNQKGFGSEEGVLFLFLYEPKWIFSLVINKNKIKDQLKRVWDGATYVREVYKIWKY